MQEHTLHTSRYGMAVPTADDRGFELRQVTSLRWRNFTSAMRRVVDGVRIESDELSLLSNSPSESIEQHPAGEAATAPAGGRVLSVRR